MSALAGAEPLVALRARAAEMTAALEALVLAESPSGDEAALAGCAHVVGRLAHELLGVEPVADGPADARWLRLDLGAAPRVLLLGHYDTVWPVGTLATMPFALRDGHASGPGGFDMKAGIVQGLFALSLLPRPCDVTLLLTADEEVGSVRSRASIERLAAQAEAVLVLEPSAAGALKTARKGVATYQLEIAGRAAHAGLEPERGANAAVALGHLAVTAATLADDLPGATLTPTLAAAGSAINVVAARASLTLDARTTTLAQQAELARRIDALAAAPAVPGTHVTVRVENERPPLEAAASAALFARAERIAAGLGLEPLRGVAVGGGSDGNLTAAVGTPTLDGLGAVGGGAHAADEHVAIARMAERAALVAALVADLLERRTDEEQGR
ncbi:M20/M25/M40 family metallo-hydrolase [Conexibacter stalactiti]|uniref:M20/M25/M40 family metallo-hydrolase n=1 Tax=Conexibacter stalactiti TaxID=1940611 RepID=A0ABU4HZB8_9ACTN|nr:M20/M25/M40 family metallo-hydrolase [Conexibacter stalactiti]MDW5597409.1 M20/M25/M40 family metallo-hydrolase [Conexibacter stalactiti]MEC5038051.1 M20/M25/M40 family metallo-hydrolase [Conexibacter stalactiti]